MPLNTITGDPFDLYVHWISADGSVSPAVMHSSLHYDGVVPQIGDVLTVHFLGDEDYSAMEVIERYHVENAGLSNWHVILRSIELPTDRARILKLV